MGNTSNKNQHNQLHATKTYTSVTYSLYICIRMWGTLLESRTLFIYEKTTRFFYRPVHTTH